MKLASCTSSAVTPSASWVASSTSTSISRRVPTSRERRAGPKEAKSTVLTVEQEAVIVPFRRHTLLPLDDCLYAPQARVPILTRSSLHRRLQRYGISGLPQVEAR